MVKPISLFAPFGGPEESAAVARVLSGQWWGRGPEVAAFESEFAAYTGWRYCVTTNSATAALHLAMAWARKRRGNFAFAAVPTMTFCSDATAAQQAGIDPLFLDCDEDGQAIPTSVRVSPVAAVAVHFGGRPMDLTEWPTAYPGALLIEDCAHSLGSDQKPQGDCACYSFHAVKPLATGDGGAICTNDKDLADFARRMAWLGIDRGTSERSTPHGYDPGYDVREPGFKCHWNDILAAIGRVQLRRLPETTARRRQIAALYHEALAGCRPIVRPRPCPGSSWHLYPIAADRSAELGRFLQAAGITTGVHYRPVHSFSCYARAAADCPNALARWGVTRSLPCHAGLSDADVLRVAEAVSKFYEGV